MYDINPPRFPDTVEDGDKRFSSVKVDGFIGLQSWLSIHGPSDGIVILCFDNDLCKEQLKNTVYFICENGTILLEKALKSFIKYYRKEEFEYLCDSDRFSEIKLS